MESTPLPTIPEENIPQWINDAASGTGMTPSEIIYVYNIIKTAVRENNPRLIIDFIQFPLHENDRCPGDIIETPEEFINRFASIVDEITRNDIINFTTQSIVIKDQLVGLGVNKKQGDLDYFDTLVWYGHECNSENCDEGKIIFYRFMNYLTYWEMVVGYPESQKNTPQPTYDISLINYGKYEAVSFIDMASSHYEPPDENIVPWKQSNITITESTFTIEPFRFEGTGSCTYKEIESCPVDERRYAPGWYGYNWPYLQIICEDEQIYKVYILGNDKIAFEINWLFEVKGYGYPFLVFELSGE
jgi:hypothetical protein